MGVQDQHVCSCETLQSSPLAAEISRLLLPYEAATRSGLLHAHRYTTIDLASSTNAIESLFSNVRRRTDPIDAFTTETSCLTIVWAVMQDIRLPKIPVG